MNNIISDIGDFIFVEDSPKKCDVIVTVGGSYPQIAEKAAELYRAGNAPYVVAGGGFSVKTGRFNGVKDKVEIYNKDYKTECDFYTDVLIRNGVPSEYIIREDRSGHTRENAEFAFEVLHKARINVSSLILVCKRFHARRCQMFFASVFKGVDISVVPTDVSEVGDMQITKENWHCSEYGIKRVLGELSRCGNQMAEADVISFSGDGRI
ncbi:MAG: YdcF family protein [Oscillospiraceae bacterium]|nr:YdcF family protein [Oscillospiraceae bacterium]